MNSFSTAAPAAQVVLDAYDSIVLAIEVANKAVLDAVHKISTFDMGIAPNLLGCDAETIQKVSDIQPSPLLNQLQTSTPIFFLRFAAPAFAQILNKPSNAGAAVDALLATFTEDVPIRPAIADKVLDSHASVVLAIEVANKAIIDLVRKFASFDDAMAPNYLGCDMETIKKIANIQPSRLLDLLHTSIPIFSLRFATPAFAEILNNPSNPDAVLNAMLATFANQVSLRSAA